MASAGLSAQVSGDLKGIGSHAEGGFFPRMDLRSQHEKGKQLFNIPGETSMPAYSGSFPVPASIGCKMIVTAHFEENFISKQQPLAECCFIGCTDIQWQVDEVLLYAS